MIAAQHLPYATYLERLRRLPVGGPAGSGGGRGIPAGGGRRGAAVAGGVQAGDGGAACGAVMDLLAVLSPAGVRRSLVHAAGRAGCRAGTGRWLRGAGGSGSGAGAAGRGVAADLQRGRAAVTAHRLVMRVIRENLAASSALAAVCEAAAAAARRAGRGRCAERWHEDRAAARDLVEQVMALAESAARCPPGSDLDRLMLRLQLLGSRFPEPSR